MHVYVINQHNKQISVNWPLLTPIDPYWPLLTPIFECWLEMRRNIAALYLVFYQIHTLNKKFLGKSSLVIVFNVGTITDSRICIVGVQRYAFEGRISCGLDWFDQSPQSTVYKVLIFVTAFIAPLITMTICHFLIFHAVSMSKERLG